MLMPATPTYPVTERYQKPQFLCNISLLVDAEKTEGSKQHTDQFINGYKNKAYENSLCSAGLSKLMHAISQEDSNRWRHSKRTVDSEDCKGKPDGHYDISCRSYVECKSEVATTVNCPTVGNTQYVYDGGKCVNASTVGPPCGDLRDCTGKADGGYPDHYNNCTSYYVCSSGHFFGHHLCAPGHLPTIMTKVSHLSGSIQNTEIKEQQKVNKDSRRVMCSPGLLVFRNVKYEQIIMCCCTGHIPTIMTKVSHMLGSIQNTEVKELHKIPSGSEGMGRTGKLKSPVPLAEAVKLVKSHLGLSHIRLASSPGIDYISSVAVCAGSGSSVLKNIPVFLYVTGEMSHHDVLHTVQSGTNVILCDHINTERGFLKVFKGRLDEIFSRKINVFVSDVDRDPLQIV
ncbi:hypothetical protein FSP39_018218 [Pinctada imbricata]|uniref:NIF3-like protein 1 n=1 Tax=Pinctada imbricata TaxID=66713 RepID=A0AA88XX24_PINIB|nr:hypothetical protein FSP39_018218 [Pinctada imbricata]